jgi:hypothetical protein
MRANTLHLDKWLAAMNNQVPELFHVLEFISIEAIQK